MNAAEFHSLVVREFPDLAQDFDEWGDELHHLQMMEFLIFTQGAIAARSFETVEKCFAIATAALNTGDKALRNAIYVSFLEGLDFRSEAGKHAATLMPSNLKKGRQDILDYDQRLLGRKWPTDDRE
jgi:hypothetical protein